MQTKNEMHNRLLRFAIAGIPLIRQSSNCLLFLLSYYVRVNLGGGNVFMVKCLLSNSNIVILQGLGCKTTRYLVIGFRCMNLITLIRRVKL